MIAELYGKSVFSFLKKLPNYFPKWLYHFSFTPAMNESSYCSTSSPAFCVVSVLDFSHSNRFAVVSHCCFNLQFLVTYDVEHLFVYSFPIGTASLLRCLFRSFPQFLVELFSYCWVLRILCIFWILLLYQMCVLQIFPPSLWLVFCRAVF